MKNCLEMRDECGVQHPSQEVCKDTGHCPCWSDKIGCKGIRPMKLLIVEAEKEKVKEKR